MELKCSKGWILLPRHYTTNICALAKKALQCYNGLEESIKVNKVLMWMGPEAYVKHELHPNSALPTGKNAKKEKGHIAEKCPSKEKANSSNKGSSKQKQIPEPKKKFHEATADSEDSEADFSEYDTDEITIQVDSVERTDEETKFTETHFGKKLANHVTKVYLDEDQSPNVLYTTVELELPDGSTKRLKGKVDTGAQVNLINYTTFREIFQPAIDETFSEIPDAYCIADDVLISARTRKEHDLAVNRIIQRCRNSGFSLNPKKAKILLEEINYFGHTLTKEGLKPGTKKVQGIKRLAVPRTSRSYNHC